MNLEKISKCKALVPADHGRLKDSLLLIAGGEFVDKLADQGLFTVKELIMLSKEDKVIGGLFEEARRIGNEIRQIQREDAADHRAINGTEEPIFSHKGDYLGTKVNHHDSLMALMLKANNPDKYGSGNSAPGSGFVLNVNLGIERGPKVVEAECNDGG